MVVHPWAYYVAAKSLEHKETWVCCVYDHFPINVTCCGRDEYVGLTNGRALAENPLHTYSKKYTAASCEMNQQATQVQKRELMENENKK